MVKVRAMRTVENALRRYGFYRIAGVDEVGRGCLAGPVVAAAVILDPDKQVQESMRLLFATFRRIGSALGTAKAYREQGSAVPTPGAWRTS